MYFFSSFPLEQIYVKPFSVLFKFEILKERSAQVEHSIWYIFISVQACIKKNFSNSFPVEQFCNFVTFFQFGIPQTPNSDQEEIRYGPFSDGEADRVTKRPTGGNLRGGRGRFRRQSTSSYCGTTSNVVSTSNFVASSSNGDDFPPHYVTLSRATLDQVRSPFLNFFVGFNGSIWMLSSPTSAFH